MIHRIPLRARAFTLHSQTTRRCLSALVRTEVTPDKIGIITLCDPDRLNALTGKWSA
jgi:hypothetical protein